MTHLFFDLDNTLWDFDRNSSETLQKIFAEKDFSKKLNTGFTDFHEFYVKKNNELWHQYYFNKIEKKELRFKRFYDSFLNFGLDDLELSKEIAEEYVKISPYSKALVPGCVEVLEHFSKSFSLHIITNGFSEVQNIKIDNCGLRKYFKEIIISDEHGLTKPNIEIFRLAEQLADTDPGKCIMIGDNWVSDIEGAIGAGWRAVYLSPNNVPEGNYTKVPVIRELKELRDLIQ
jgi:putative hydrolase of the HAD superfamily